MSLPTKVRTEQAAAALCDRIEEHYLESRDRMEQRAQTGFLIALGAAVLTVGLMAKGGMPLVFAIPVLLLPWILPWPMLYVGEKRAIRYARTQVRKLIPEAAKANDLSAVEVEKALSAAADQRIAMLKSLPSNQLWTRPLATKVVQK